MTTDLSGGMNDVEWFERTAHCGRCGQPGDYCLCRASSPCGCRHLHPLSSGIAADALKQFAAAAPDQDGLFDLSEGAQQQ